ncbi:uncharacterized protein LOC107847770 isoform X1 [Capsicum annuum]|uniref:uncharacterized protein LOC107847770 isoform X1 n=1 Tax=Capsicum annuum TaxID=4072 RepID=UPI001FB1455E|nr:uncharacterized protein LOC107847770 isoform X1 [Capsicum annuum]
MATDNKSKPKNGNKTKNRQRYRPNNKAVKKGAYPLRPGVQGFYITCDGGRERQASQEAVNVIDSFYEELVQGTNLKLGQRELSEKPANKKTVFKYSDSSSSSDGDEDEHGDNGNDEHQTKEEISKIEQHQEKLDDEIDSLKTGKSEPENKDNISTDVQMQGNIENKKELETTHEPKDIEVGEPPAKKQYVKREASEAGNIAFGKTEEKSIDKLIEAELAELGDKSKRCFSYLDSGCNGVVFVHMRKKDGDPNPKEIVQHMMSSLALTKKHISRFILRVLPVEVTCYASEEEIGKAIQPLIMKHLPAESDTPKKVILILPGHYFTVKFAVLYEARANTGINRMKIIDTVAKLVPSPHKVDLSNPEINIVVQIVKTVCLLGVVEKFKELSKYNLRQLTSKN